MSSTTPFLEQWKDDAAQLERQYRTTWLCSACGRRHSMSVSVCDNCMDKALEADRQKLRDLDA